MAGRQQTPSPPTGRPDDDAAATTGTDEAGPLVVDLVGEEPVVAWPLLLRRQLGGRVRSSDRYPWWVLASTLVGLFAAGFTITIVAVSIPTIASDLDSSETALTWIVTGPFLVFALSMPLFGRLGDIYGHRAVYLLGSAGFVIATVLTALAWDGTSLIVIRVLGAIPSAAVGPTSMALIMRAFPERERVKAMGWWSLVAAGAPVIGLVAGGPAVEAFGWRAIFAAQAPLALVGLAVAVVVLTETPRQRGATIDLAGIASLAAATVAPLLALTFGAVTGWGSPLVVGLFLATPALLWLFVVVERRASEPVLPPELFSRPNFTASLVAQFGVNFAYMGGFIVTPLLVQQVFEFSVSQTSLAMIARPLSFSIAAPLAGYVAVRIGERRSAVIGCVLVVVSMGCFVFAAGNVLLALVFAGLVVSGVGIGVSQPSLISVVANAVEPERLGVANAAQQMVAQIGVVAGIQVLSVIQGSISGERGFAAAYFVGGVLAVVGVLGAIRLRSSADLATGGPDRTGPDRTGMVHP